MCSYIKKLAINSEDEASFFHVILFWRETGQIVSTVWTRTLRVDERYLGSQPALTIKTGLDKDEDITARRFVLFPALCLLKVNVIIFTSSWMLRSKTLNVLQLSCGQGQTERALYVPGRAEREAKVTLQQAARSEEGCSLDPPCQGTGLAASIRSWPSACQEARCPGAEVLCKRCSAALR